jgi:hypothetical protein
VLLEAAAAQAAAGAVLAGDRKPRLAVVAQQGCEVARALVASGLFEAQVWWCPAAAPARHGALERIYRWVDRAVFGKHHLPDVPGVVFAGSAHELGLLLPAGRFDAVLDLVGCLPSRVNDFSVLALRVGQLPAAQTLAGVRAVLGLSQGTAHLLVSCGERLLFDGYAAVDHRSLQRSADWVLLKWPMVVLAALRRLHEPGGTASEPPASAQQLPAWRQHIRLVAHAFARVTRRQQWRMHLLKGDAVAGACQPWVDLRPGPQAFWADPFVHTRGNTHWVFFEELPFATGKGHLSVLAVAADGSVSEPVQVVCQPWHLSYPFLLQHQGQLMMVPESSANRSVDLYTCEVFPHQWRLTRSLIQGLRLADASLVQWHGRWWLFATHALPGASLYDELHIFSAPSLAGPFVAHRLNPVKLDARTARPAGAFVVQGGRLLRPVQDCGDTYGGAVLIQEVTRLDDDGFEEHTVSRLTVPHLAPHAQLHTLNSDGPVLCVDSLHHTRRWP